MIYRKVLLPRLIFLPFLITKIFLEILNLFTFHIFYRNRKRKSKLCIESGIKGWELIDYKELYSSSIEYLGVENVVKVEIDKSGKYINQLKNAIRTLKPTHYIYDSRTGNQNWIIGMIQSFRIALIFQINGITPVCILTDFPVRSWRTQCAIVSAKRGIVVTLMSPKDFFSIFPHNRIIGPLTMPFSRKTGLKLNELIAQNRQKSSKSIVFSGSLYEPRTSILKSINIGLKQKGLEIEMKARNIGTQRFKDDDYWCNLINASIVVTTSNQINSNKTDFSHINHLIYRYLEVPASGSLLIAQNVPSIERFLKPNIDFVIFETIEEAIDKINYYFNHDNERENIAKSGYLKAQSIINSNLYWVTIDTALGKNSLL